jgi:ribonuclease BN (tRNA processing enzyme)
MLLIDFADTKDPHDDGDRRCNLADLLRADLKEKSRDYFDVVAFSHLDKDHITGSSDFFFLEHAAKYQGRGRIKINVMWVPAAVITEPSPDDDEARILQREARYRFRRAKGIRVFSRPERLEKWCERNGVDIHERLHLITNAGEVAPDFSLAKDQL